jgi:hypothetical protein
VLKAYLELTSQLLDDSKEEEGPPQDKGLVRHKNKTVRRRLAKATLNHSELRRDAEGMIAQIRRFKEARCLLEVQESIIAFNKKSRALAKILLEVPPNLPILATLIDDEAYGRASVNRKIKEGRSTTKATTYGELSIR